MVFVSFFRFTNFAKKCWTSQPTEKKKKIKVMKNNENECKN